MPIDILNAIKGIESRIPLMTADSLRSIREDIDRIGGYSEYVATDLRTKLWKQARFQGLI